MTLKGPDINILSNLVSQLKDQSTCLEWYYVAAATATCGHTLCYGCWHGRRNCPTCASPVERRTLQLDLPLQKQTENVQKLVLIFEKTYKIKLNELTLEVPSSGTQEDPDRNVKDWLANSKNHFSAPLSSQSTQDFNEPVKYSTTEVQVHSTNVKMKSPTKITHVPQDDWNKISVIEEGSVENHLDVIEPMQIESLDKDDTAYSTENPRRSSRNKQSTTDSIKVSNNIQTEKISTKTSAIVSIKPSKKLKQTWSSVKKMKTEFNKLNKETKNKLNVSIEMYKKTQMSNSNAKQLDEDNLSSAIIENDTPNVLQTDREIERDPSNKQSTSQNTIQSDSKATFYLAVNEKRSPQENVCINPPSLIENKDKGLMNIGNRNINENLTEKSKVKFFKKAPLHTNTKENKQKIYNLDTDTADDVQISIKFCNTITNIFIKKKENDVQVNVNSDRGIQTSLRTQTVADTNITATKNDSVDSQNIEKIIGKSVPVSGSTQTKTQSINKSALDRVENKSVLTKKNTASADTGTAPFEITESVEKEMSDIMKCVESGTVIHTRKSQTKKSSKDSQPLQGSSQKENIPEGDSIDDADIFDGELSTGPNVQSLKTTKNLPSEILVPTQNKQNKRKLIEMTNDCLMFNASKKKAKISDKEHNLDIHLEKVKSHIHSECSMNNSESQDYDLVMDKVFANIDKDIGTISEHVNLSKANIKADNVSKAQMEIKNKFDKNDQIYSENVFSIMDADHSHLTSNKNTQVAQPALDMLSPTLCQEFSSVQDENNEINNVEMVDLGTPFQENYDSDKSVVEETPQKNVTIRKIKHNSSASFQIDSNMKKESKSMNKSNKQSVKSVYNVSDSVTDSVKMCKENTVIEVDSRLTLETPLNISRFVDQIKHNSTPVARKSLSFSRQNEDRNIDPDQTICPSSMAVAKITQEKEFMKKVFDTSAGSPPYAETVRPKKLCVAGSCLTSTELAKLKLLCKQRGWSFVEKYSKELTHLIVGVDEENRSLRSVKYICTLAAGKWIINFDWVVKCLQSQTILPEEPFEVLDANGEPGPRRSRLSKRKLFKGMTFYCMEPFSVLDKPTLQVILEDAGARVVDDPKEVRVLSDRPALLLAEPENTQEDRFTYIALELGVVPVNSEWALNCLGNYTLSSFLDLLLCPHTLLPAATKTWPAELLETDEQ